MLYSRDIWEVESTKLGGEEIQWAEEKEGVAFGLHSGFCLRWGGVHVRWGQQPGKGRHEDQKHSWFPKTGSLKSSLLCYHVVSKINHAGPRHSLEFSSNRRKSYRYQDKYGASSQTKTVTYTFTRNKHKFDWWVIENITFSLNQQIYSLMHILR